MNVTPDLLRITPDEKPSLYARHRKVYPKLAHGWFRRLKWLVMAVTLAIYYITPWLRWNRGENFPDQAVLIDIPARRFYFFFIEVWPQQIYLLAGLLILAALTLFLVTSVAGRVWCGYTCPQTVWTDLFVMIERVFEGDRSERIRRDRGPLTLDKLWRKASKHAVWLIVALGTGGAWIFYFVDAPTLLTRLFSLEASTPVYVFTALFTLTTYVLGGFAREQVCTYMCPWPRIQAGLQDEHSLLVTYRAWRGEARAPYAKDSDWSSRGHCIDCGNCVTVCPQGIDIRDGQQLPCIGCALCIDACDSVMEKVGLPRGLVAYDTLENLANKATGPAARVRLIRPRTMLYAGLIVLVAALMAIALVTATKLDMTVLHDRNPLFVSLTDGSVRNGYTLKIINRSHDTRHFVLSLDGLPGASLAIVGDGSHENGIAARPDDLRSVRVFVTQPRDLRARGPADFSFVLTDRDSELTVSVAAVFNGPGR